MYYHADSVGIIEHTCTGETSYTETEGICVDGEVVYQDYNTDCDTGTKCCQSGKPGTSDAVTCIADTSDCNEWVDPSYVYKLFYKTTQQKNFIQLLIRIFVPSNKLS